MPSVEKVARRLAFKERSIKYYNTIDRRVYEQTDHSKFFAFHHSSVPGWLASCAACNVDAQALVFALRNWRKVAYGIDREQRCPRKGKESIVLRMALQSSDERAAHFFNAGPGHEPAAIWRR
jgi:hypothetical protein